ncbi:MAG: hypothetical protein IJX45_10260 [Spirochaetaceae bacterium]|nr:hypothetical protein [Spirochaetaceae bacterium]
MSTNRRFISFFLILIAILLFSCDNGLRVSVTSAQEDGRAYLFISTGDNSRTVFPEQLALDSDMSLSFELKGGLVGSGQTVLREWTATSSTAYVAMTGDNSLTVEAGEWNFTLEAKRNNLVILSAAINSMDIVAGVNKLSFGTMEENRTSGTGTVDVTVKLPADSGVSHVGTGVLCVENGGLDDTRQELTLETGSDGAPFFRYYRENVESGSYSLMIQLTQDKDPNVKYVFREAVQVAANLTSSKTRSISSLSTVYSVTYNLNTTGGTGSWKGNSIPQDFYNPYDILVLPVAGTIEPPTGYFFGGWYEDSSFSGNPVTMIGGGSSDIPTGAKSFYAKWTQELYVGGPMASDANDGGNVAAPLATIQAAVDKIVAVNDETSSYTILLTGDVDDATTGSYTANNKALVNINPGTKQDGFTYKNLNLTIKSDTDGTTRTVNAGRTATNTGRVLYVRGDATTVTLKDLIVTGGYSDDSGGGIYINNSKVTLDDVTVDSNTSVKEGGGIFLSSLSSLTMTNSTVSNNNSTQNNGGGVYFKGKNFTMKTGSSISENTATNGGGVCVDSGGSFIMNDGIISDNFAGFDGGGVYVSQNATFIMKGGSIKANDVGAGASNFSGGGGVYVNGGTFTMEDGEITQNNGLKYGGGVCVISGTLSMSGGEISSNTVTDGGGVYVVAGATLEMTGGVISNNAATGNGGGVNLSGTLTMTGGSISGNTSTMSGKGVYAYDAVAINLGDSAVIAADNDIKLGNGKTITITSSLTGYAPVATIEPNSYSDTTQVLAAGSGVNLAGEVGKFAVTASGSDTYVVKVDDADSTKGVLSKGIVVAGAEAALAISVLSGSETYTVRVTGELTEEQITGADGIRNELLGLVSSQPNIKVNLDLSGSTITSLPDDAFYSSTTNAILLATNLVGVVFPSSLQTIGCGTFRSAGLTSVVFVDSNATWKIEGRDGAVVEANFQPSTTNTATAIEYLTGPTSDRNMEMDMTFTNAYKWTKN